MIAQADKGRKREHVCWLRTRNGNVKIICIYFCSGVGAAGCCSVETFRPFVNYVTGNYFIGHRFRIINYYLNEEFK